MTALYIEEEQMCSQYNRRSRLWELTSSVSGVQLLYNVVLVSAVWLSESAICIHIPCLCHHRVFEEISLCHIVGSHCYCSVAVMSKVSNSLRPHRPQHARLPHPSLSPRVCSDSCPLGQWCYPTISSTVSHFSFCLQSFPESGSFPMSQLFTSGGQNIGASNSASVLPVHIQGWFPLEFPHVLLYLIFICNSTHIYWASITCQTGGRRWISLWKRETG